MELHTDLALPNFSEFKKGHLHLEECIPEELEVGVTYNFLKKGHWNYHPNTEVTLMEMKEGDVLFDMRARILILSTEFIIEDEQSYTKGSYRVEEIITG